jgi:hypothetical protein
VNIHEFIVNMQVLMYDGLYKRDRLCAAATAVAGGRWRAASAAPALAIALGSDQDQDPGPASGVCRPKAPTCTCAGAEAHGLHLTPTGLAVEVQQPPLQKSNSRHFSQVLAGEVGFF